MSGPINHARAKISKIFNGEPQSYTRFNLAPNTDGDNSHVEVKLSTEMEEELDLPETGRRHAASPPTQRHLCTSRNMVYVVLGVLLIFVTGYLVGYVSHRKPIPSHESEAVTCLPTPVEQSKDEGVVVQKPEPTLDWSDITGMLRSQLLPINFVETLREFSMNNHQAGSKGDEELANKVLDIFKSLRMDPWNDEHYVQLQVPLRDNINKVFLGSEEVGSPQGFLAYSASGSKQGRVVYGNYGKLEDLKYLKDVGIDLNGTVLLLRTGEISLAEKVANAAKFAAVAVLIYPEIDGIYNRNIELYGHVHLGTGDPYTPGFPSFNHTQFPPTKSSGLPEILAQTITADMARKIFEKMDGKEAPDSFRGTLLNSYKLGGSNSMVTVLVNNSKVHTRIHNVFGVIKGFTDPDRYVVIGAQRDSFSWGYAKSTVGTSLLVELAKAFTKMIKDGFRPRRSIVFASWSAGDFGSVGATEWLEGYLPSLDRKAFTYISLDGAVSGGEQFKASGSPLLHTLLQETLNEVKIRAKNDRILYPRFDVVDFQTKVLEPMKMEDGAYPFLAFSGIPSISFRFIGASSQYKYFGTPLDTKENLDIATGQRVGDFCVSVAQVAGQMALRLVHDHLLRLDVTRYTNLIRLHVAKVKSSLAPFEKSTQLSALWLISAVGSYRRAADTLLNVAQNSDLEDAETCRQINDYIMRVEHNLLSPYVSPRDVPFRHILFGSGDYTMTALQDHLKSIRTTEAADVDFLRNQLALATWTIQSCANDLAGDVWVLDNMI
ncbi:transferrin receptor 1b [Brachyhypopomus gauderio]|uniref:transferrin receptor 1b n=1 Tax=Brachyhypopomus gauderio TaxID=698409 RepID=UPI0040425A7A